MAKTPIHLLVRFSDKLFRVEDTIVEHNKIIQAQGSVWFGKVGKPLGKPNIEKLKNQIEESIPTYMYLVQREGKTYLPYRGSILEISRDYPKAEKQLIPNYYFTRSLIENITLWVKLSEIGEVAKDELAHLGTVSSVQSIYKTLETSMAALFIIRERDTFYDA